MFRSLIPGPRKESPRFGACSCEVLYFQSSFNRATLKSELFAFAMAPNLVTSVLQQSAKRKQTFRPRFPAPRERSELIQCLQK
jgi:hypothetical protein